MAAIGGRFQRPNYLKLDGIKSPGIVRVSGAALKRKWDKRPGYGTSGATLVYTGEDLSDFTATFSFYDWDGSQGSVGHRRDDWLDFARAVLVKDPSTTAKQIEAIKFRAASSVFVTDTSAAIARARQPKAQLIEYWEVNDPPVSITSVVVLEVSQPDTSDETGLVTVTVKFTEYRAPKAALGKPTGVNVPGKKNQPTAQDEADKQIAALVTQLKQEVAKG